VSEPLLVFGAGGQAGQELLSLASARGIAAVGLTHGEADIADERAVADAFARVRPKIAVNVAGYTAVDRAEHDRDAAFAANAEGPAMLGRVAAAAGTFVIHLSTDYVFNGKKAGAYTEDDPVAPVNVYGESKAAGEAALKRSGARHIVLRTSWLYSTYGENFVKTILRLAGERSELRVVADQVGCPTAARDLAEAVLAVIGRIAADARDVPDLVHFAGTGVTSWHGFAKEIVANADLTGPKPPVTAITTAEYPTPARRPKNSALDSSRFERFFGYRARPWQEAAAEITRHVQEHTRREAVP